MLSDLFPSHDKSCGSWAFECDHYLRKFEQFLEGEPLPPTPKSFHAELKLAGYQQAVIAEAKIEYFHPAPEKDWDGGLITVNPNGQDPLFLLQCWKQIKKLSYGVKMLMCIEQRGKTVEDMHGYHMHIAVKRTEKDKEKNSYKRFLATIKRCCSNSLVHFKTCQPQLFDNFVKYLQKEGERSEDQKLKSAVDKIMREKYILKNLYE